MGDRYKQSGVQSNPSLQHNGHVEFDCKSFAKKDWVELLLRTEVRQVALVKFFEDAIDLSEFVRREPLAP